MSAPGELPGAIGRAFRSSFKFRFGKKAISFHRYHWYVNFLPVIEEAEN